MLISDVIRSKGDLVVTIAPGRRPSRRSSTCSTSTVSVPWWFHRRHDHRRHRERARRRPPPAPGRRGVLDQPVSDIMTADVRTAAPDDNIEDMARVMTEPGCGTCRSSSDGELVAIISIGDVVKHRIDELQVERDQLVDYIHR